MEQTLVLSTLFGAVLGTTTNYSTYYGVELNSTQVAEFQANNTVANCTIAVETCNSTEGRRIDGTCNNLNKPSYGGARTPYYRLLPAAFNPTSKTKWDPRLAKDNTSLVAMRVVRTALWSEGRVEDKELTSCVAHMAVYFVTDITNTQDTTNYVSWRPHCCQAAGKTDYACAPNLVPKDDFVHRFSGITCLNMTRPLTYQTSGCVSYDTVPLRIVDATPTQDLSPIYGNTIESGRRTYENGQLTVEEINNRTFPPTRKKHLTKDGVFTNSTASTSYYNASLSPQISLEYPYILRWLHGLQDGVLKLISANGTVVESFPIVNLTSNVNYLKQGSNMDYVAQGCFRQPTANSKDYIADPDIVERGLGGAQVSNDIMTNDGAKGRYYGFQGYVYYLAYCYGDNITSFTQLSKYIDIERIHILEELYNDVRDIDLLAGAWAERVMNDSHVPPIVYCIVKEQMIRTRASDRHWFENNDRSNAFTTKQLAAIRKVTIARMLCDIGGGVTEIQPKAFLLPSKSNAIVNCSKIPDIDYSAWADTSCWYQLHSNLSTTSTK